MSVDTVAKLKEEIQQEAEDMIKEVDSNEEEENT